MRIAFALPCAATRDATNTENTISFQVALQSSSSLFSTGCIHDTSYRHTSDYTGLELHVTRGLVAQLHQVDRVRRFILVLSRTSYNSHCEPFPPILLARDIGSLPFNQHIYAHSNLSLSLSVCLSACLSVYAYASVSLSLSLSLLSLSSSLLFLRTDPLAHNWTWGLLS